MTNAVFENLDREAGALWGRHLVALRHRLHLRDLFTEEKLGAFIDEIPSDRMTITTMAKQGHDHRSWAHCDRGDLTGVELLRAVAGGHIWINLHSVHRLSPELNEALDQIYSEVGVHRSDLTVVKKSMGLLVSSPNAQVFYHADVPGQSLWQIRGRKRIWIYPNGEPFLKARDLENIIRRRVEEDLPYEPWFDKHARVFDLEPGDMLHWPLNGPHRVENLETMNVSLTTEHWTPEINRHLNVQYGNGILRDAGFAPKSSSLYGPSALFKTALAKGWWLSGQQKRQRFRPAIRYRLDRRQPELLAPIAQEPLLAAE